MKKVWKIIIRIVLILLAAALAYFAYVLIAFHRIGDQDLTVNHNGASLMAQTDKEYRILSYNIGFGAYESDYSFFMDGGTQSWAWSKERLDANMTNITQFLKKQDADFTVLQEVDLDSTRTYHRNEAATVIEAMGAGQAHVWAQNYDSPFLFYPFTQPHGRSQSSLLTLSPCDIASSQRVELPIETGLMKLVDYDRCYQKNRIPMEGGRELVLYNFHLSAYTSDGTIAIEQLQMLIADMQDEYERGNYCVAGGDFNKDLLGNSREIFGGTEGYSENWAQPIPEGTFDGLNISLEVPFDEKHPVASCRTASAPYHEGQFCITVDGFLVSDNVTVKESHVEDLQYAYSDHNPVGMTFVLEK